MVSEIDLMERPTAGLPLNNGTVTVHTKPYEINTIRVRFGSELSAPADRSF